MELRRGEGKIRKVKGSDTAANRGRETESRKSVTTTNLTAVLTQPKYRGGRGRGGRSTAKKNNKKIK